MKSKPTPDFFAKQSIADILRGIFSNGVQRTGARKDIVCIDPSHHLVTGYIQNGRLVCGALLHRMQLKHAPSLKNDYSRDIRTPF